MYMITASQLEELVLSQKETFLSRIPGIPREIATERFPGNKPDRRDYGDTAMRQVHAPAPDFSAVCGFPLHQFRR